MTQEIELATTPEEVAKLMTPKPQVANQPVPATSGASVDDILAQIEQDKMSKTEQAKALEQLQAKSKPQPKPLQLKYIYVGNDSKGHEVKTILNTFNGETIASAFCLICDETVLQIKVEPINNPKIEVKVEPEKVPEVAKSVEKPKGDIMPRKEKK